VLFQTLPFALPASRIAELLGIYKAKHLIMLDSAAAPSRYSILSATPEENVSLTYRNGDDFYVLQGQQIKLNGMSIWEAIAAIMQEYKCSVGPAGSPFWGGLSGYISYEAGLTTLDVPVAPSPTKTPDINLVLVKRSVVVDYKDKVMYLQSLVLFSQASDNWLQTCAEAIQHGAVQDCRLVNGGHAAGKIRVKLPMKENYIQSIRRCQELLAEGQSYELCLTDLTRIDCGTKREAWELYQTLRLRNPSPFACFMALPGVDLLSSSPERFLSWTRDGLCELRPIKGTIRKQPGSSLEEAKRELNNPKDYAENLMIVDLIRHDLHQIAKRVSVPSLMQVEEYETVYQLVSVIQGYVGDSVSAPGQQAFSGFDVLAHALPPGSMTGAPKKRSVELLQTIEGHNRGIYSGVCGYLSVCGAGDWSVIIRSAFRHSDEAARSGTADTWWIGAGGAITTLSDPEAEWEEMLTKLQSTLPGFGSDVDFIS
jgi:para-aminobenzoate synthetase